MTMPFKSEAQRRYMFSQHPGMAKEWQAKTPKGKKLPEHVGKKKQASDVMMGAFFDELQKIASVEKDAIGLGTIAQGAGKLFTGMRSSIGKGLMGAGQAFMSKAAPAAAKSLGPNWTMTAAHKSLPGSSWSKIMQGPQPGLAGAFKRFLFRSRNPMAMGSGLTHRVAEQSPAIRAAQLKRNQMLQSKGIAIPDELKREMAVPVGRAGTPARLSAPAAAPEAPPTLAPAPKPFRRGVSSGAAVGRANMPTAVGRANMPTAVGPMPVAAPMAA